MSYPRGLDEVPEEELRAELAQREARQATGVCDYCGGFANDPPCRFPERHERATKTYEKPKVEVVGNMHDLLAHVCHGDGHDHG